MAHVSRFDTTQPVDGLIRLVNPRDGSSLNLNQSICRASCSSSCWIVATHGGAGRISLFFSNNGERRVWCPWSSKVSLQPSVSGIYIGLSLLLRETSGSNKCSRNEELNHLATTIILKLVGRIFIIFLFPKYCNVNTGVQHYLIHETYLHVQMPKICHEWLIVNVQLFI